MGEVREPVDYRDLAVARELLDGLVRVDAQHHRVRHAAGDAGHVGDALTAAETDLGGGQIDAVTAELRYADIERQSGAEARLLEDQSDRTARETPCGRSRLQARALIQQERELVPLQVADR